MAINTYAALSPDILLNPSPGCIILSGLKTLNSIISEIFANGEQGFAYNPNDLTTMFQDAAGTIPVTAAGQPVGLMLDKSKGLALGVNIATATAPFTVYRDATTNTISPDLAMLVANKSYVVTAVVSSASGTTAADFRVNNNIANIVQPSLIGLQSGTFTSVLTAKSGGALRLFGQNAGVNFTVTSLSIHELKGNHAYQSTSSMRPLLVASPQRLDYDTADDKLITSLPAQLTGCTVVRATPNVGTQILTNQTIATPYNDSTDHCGLIVINRALTATETSQITQLFNKAAGV